MAERAQSMIEVVPETEFPWCLDHNVPLYYGKSDAVRLCSEQCTNLLEEPCRTLVADPPWPFKDALPGPKRGASSHYKLMSIEDIKKFTLPPLAKDAYLWLWRVAAMQQEALDVCRAWGFYPATEVVWVKLSGGGAHSALRPWMGMGRTVRMSHEVALIGIRGQPMKGRRFRSRRSVIFDRVGEHSEKPESFYKLVEETTEAPYVELFARRRRTGWVTLGDEVPSEGTA